MKLGIFNNKSKHRFHSARVLSLMIMVLLPISILADTKPPNIIVIFTDDQTFRAIGYKDSAIKTPNLDALSESGIRFNHAYVASPICASSRASIMTGLYPQQHGLIALDINGFNLFRAGQQHEEQTLGKRLSKAGYLTAFFEKSHLGDPKTYGFKLGAEIGGHDDTKTFAKASKFIVSRKGENQPFFMWLAPRQPHVPLYPEKKWLDLYPLASVQLSQNFRMTPKPSSLNNQGTPSDTLYRDSDYRKNINKLPAGPPRDEQTMRLFTQAYYAVISRLDHQIGEVIKLLKESEHDCFFLSDNGYHLGSHGLGNKITMHEESVRVPMFAFGKGIAAGKTTDALVSSLDVYSTIVELAKASKPPREVMGKSLVPLFKDPNHNIRDYIYSECVGVGGKKGEGHRMIRSDRWKLILTGRNEEFLFDQKNDPYEKNNLISDHKLDKIKVNLRDHLRQWMEKNGDRPFPKN